MSRKAKQHNSSSQQLPLAWNEQRAGETRLEYLKRIRPFGKGPARSRRNVGAQFLAPVKNDNIDNKGQAALADAEFNMRLNGVVG